MKSRVFTPSVVLVALTTAMPIALAAQAHIDKPGVSIEVLGLEQWTIPMIQDSLAKYAPGVTLESHACAVIMRSKLGFADASVTTFTGFGSARKNLAIMLVEPQDSARVRYNRLPFETKNPREEWAAIIAEADAHAMAFNFAMDRLADWRAKSYAAIDVNGAHADSASIVKFWNFIDEHKSDRDLSVALSVMHSDPNGYDRMLAAGIASNFVSRDSVIHSLTRMLVQDGRPSLPAVQALSEFAQNAPRKIDWRPVAPVLHDLLNGTALFNLSATIDLLNATGAGPELASPLLSNGGEALLDLLDSRYPWLQKPAHDLLVALHGADLPTSDAWRKWVESLQSTD